MIKKIIFSVLFLCLLCTGCGKKEAFNDQLTTIAQRDKLVVGVRTDAAPFGFVDKNGNIQGFDVDLAKIIAQGILGSENKIKLVPVTATNRIMKLSSNEVDMLIAAMSVTDQRKQILDFSTPYYVAGQAILVKKGSKAKTLRDFAGKRMIIVYGSTSEKNLRDNVPEIEVIGYKNYNDAFRALKAGRADGIIADDIILLGYAMNDNSVKVLPKRYSKEPYAIVFRKEDETKNLQNKVNYILNNVKSSGKLNRLQNKWHLN